MVSKLYNLYGIAAIIGLSGFLLGLESPSLTAFLSSSQFIDYYGKLTTMEQAMIASGNSIGAIVGCVVCGALNDFVGSIISVQITCILWIIGTLIAIFLSNIYMVVIARIFKGTSMGFISTILPVYITETVPGMKGISLSIAQLSSSLGTLAIYFIGNLFQTKIQNDNSFRYTWMVEASPALVFFILSFFLPESPKWYATRNNWFEAAGVLDRLKGKNKELEKGKREALGDKFYVLSAYTLEPEMKKGTYSSLFSKRYWKYTAIGLTVQLFVQFSGTSVVMYFFVYICEMCGLNGDSKAWVIISQYYVFAIFTIFPILLIDKCRRKDSLIFGLVLLGLSFTFIWGLIFFYKIESNSMALQNTPINFELNGEPASAVLGICLFLVALFSSTILSVSWLYSAEIFPISIRSKGLSICMCVSWMLNMCSTLFVPYVFPYIHYWVFAIFACVCFLGSVLLLRFPETKDLNFLELEKLYKKRKQKKDCDINKIESKKDEVSKISELGSNVDFENNSENNKDIETITPFHQRENYEKKSLTNGEIGSGNQFPDKFSSERGKLDIYIPTLSTTHEESDVGMSNLLASDKLVMNELKVRKNTLLSERIMNSTSSSSPQMIQTAKRIKSKAIKKREDHQEREEPKPTKLSIGEVKLESKRSQVNQTNKVLFSSSSSSDDNFEEAMTSRYDELSTVLGFDSNFSSPAVRSPPIIPTTGGNSTYENHLTYEPKSFLNQKYINGNVRPLRNNQDEMFSRTISVKNNARFGSNKNIATAIDTSKDDKNELLRENLKKFKWRKFRDK